MDPLLAEALERYRRESPAARLREALAVMDDGFAVKLGNLRRQHPQATDDELDRMLAEWAQR